ARWCAGAPTGRSSASGGRSRRIQRDGTADRRAQECEGHADRIRRGSWIMDEINELQLYGTTFGTGQGEIRWDVVAQGLGCHGEYVDRIEVYSGPAKPATV